MINLEYLTLKRTMSTFKKNTTTESQVLLKKYKTVDEHLICKEL